MTYYVHALTTETGNYLSTYNLVEYSKVVAAQYVSIILHLIIHNLCLH